MAFRSELEATRERAEVAEKELASQAERIARVAEIETQLEDARRQIRESKIDLRRWVGTGLPMLLVGLVLGGGVVGDWAVGRIDAMEEEASATERRLASERDVASARAETAERGAEVARSELTAAEVEVHRLRDDVDSVLTELPFAYGRRSSPAELAPVWTVDGPAPVRPGDRCALVWPARDTGCRAEVTCAGVVIHPIGCRTGGTTRVRAYGDRARIVDDEAGWSVTLGDLAPEPMVFDPPPG